MDGKYDKEYYLLKEVAPATSYMLQEREDSGVSNPDNGFILQSPYPIHNDITGVGIVHVHQGDEETFQPCDFHKLPDVLISKRFKKFLEEFDLPKLGFYEAEIITSKDVFPDFHLMHLYNEINAVHPDRSVFRGSIERFNIKLRELSLNEAELDRYELKSRSMFYLQGCSRFVVHESIIEAIKATGLTGIGFTRVDKWNIGSMFD